MNVLSLFDGISCGRVALERAGITVDKYYASEIDKGAIAISNKNYPDIINLGSVEDWRFWGIDLSKIDLLIGGSPCFKEGTLITTDKGYKNIEDIRVGDMVLTHKNRFREVVKLMVSISSNLYELNICGSPKTEVTGDHPYYVRRMSRVWDGDLRTNRRIFSEPDWKTVSELTKGDYIGFPIYNLCENPYNLTEEDDADAVMIDNHLWLPFRNKTLLDTVALVYNFEVAEDNSYVANNCIVHNCQGFSVAGKQLNFDDPRSKLFFEYVDILNAIRERNPNVKFLLENVKMKKEYSDIITEYLGVEPIEINSSLVSAQSRRRLYWTNIKGVTQPADKGIYLKDIVHEKADMDTVMSDSWCKWFKERMDMLLSKQRIGVNSDKAVCMTARQYSNWQGNFIYEVLDKYIIPIDDTLHILENETKRGKIGFIKTDSQGNRVYSIHDKSITICGEAGGRGAKTGLYLFGCITPDRLMPWQNGQRFNDGNKFYTLTVCDKHGILTEGYVRKLTPVECERLQTLPDNYTLTEVDGKTISDTRRYRALGNGWTVDVIAHILSFLK